MNVTLSNLGDVDAILALYDIATTYQKSKGDVVSWPIFERTLVESEVKENNQFKIVIDNQIACVWAITLQDKDIWQERENDDAIYIHRIATNPNYRGYGFVNTIIDWAKTYIAQNGRNYIRLDTVGDNKGLIDYYTKSGFTFLGLYDLENTDSLPAHYKEGPVSLFEMKVER